MSRNSLTDSASGILSPPIPYACILSMYVDRYMQQKYSKPNANSGYAGPWHTRWRPSPASRISQSAFAMSLTVQGQWRYIVSLRACQNLPKSRIHFSDFFFYLQFLRSLEGLWRRIKKKLSVSFFHRINFYYERFRRQTEEKKRIILSRLFFWREILKTSFPRDFADEQNRTDFFPMNL